MIDEQTKRAMIYALDQIETSLGREEIGDLRDIMRVLVEPNDPKSKKIAEYLRECEANKELA